MFFKLEKYFYHSNAEPVLQFQCRSRHSLWPWVPSHKSLRYDSGISPEGQFAYGIKLVVTCLTEDLTVAKTWGDPTLMTSPCLWHLVNVPRSCLPAHVALQCSLKSKSFCDLPSWLILLLISVLCHHPWVPSFLTSGLVLKDSLTVGGWAFVYTPSYQWVALTL